MEDEEFVPLTDEEMAAYKSEVWEAWARDEISEAEAASLILYEAYINGSYEA
jgi:hypothetical protein